MSKYRRDLLNEGSAWVLSRRPISILIPFLIGVSHSQRRHAAPSMNGVLGIRLDLVTHANRSCELPLFMQGFEPRSWSKVKLPTLTLAECESGQPKRSLMVIRIGRFARICAVSWLHKLGILQSHVPSVCVVSMTVIQVFPSMAS